MNLVCKNHFDQLRHIYIYIHIKNSEILKNFDQYVLRLTTSECTAKLEYKEASANKHEASDGK